MKAATNNAVVGGFYTRSEAEQAINDLRTAGFPTNRIGMITKDTNGRMVNEKNGEETMVEEAAAAGAVVGAGAGALVGLAYSAA